VGIDSVTGRWQTRPVESAVERAGSSNSASDEGEGNTMLPGRTLRRVLTTALVVAGLSATTAVHPAGAAPENTVPLRMIAFGDLHGSLLPPEGPRSEVVRSDGASVPAGGAAYLAAYIRQLRGQADHSVLYSTGDTWGSSPLESAMFHDEPTVELLNDLDLTAAGLGNHEFDNGAAELRRLRDGGCHPEEGCRYGEAFDGADFPLLASNITTDTGEPAALPYSVTYIDGIPVAAIGVMPSNTPDYVRADSIEGLHFGDEVDAVNRTADALDALGVRAMIVLYKGDLAETTTDPCDPVDGRARAVATSVSPLVDLIVTADGEGHFNCSFPDPLGTQRTVVQGASHGRILSVADLVIDRADRDVLRDRTVAFNQVVTHDITPDPGVSAFVERAVDRSAETARREVGHVAAPLTRDTTSSGESTLGNLVADAQLAAGEPHGAQLALMNIDGVRADLTADGDAVSFGEAFAVHPFGNRLEIVDMTGAQIHAVLEQQFRSDSVGSSVERILAPSHTLHYTLDRLAPRGERIRDITVAGEPLDPDTVYSVVVNSFLSGGGDGFTVFAETRSRAGLGYDLDALTTYLGRGTSERPVSVPATDRIRVH